MGSSSGNEGHRHRGNCPADQDARRNIGMGGPRAMVQAQGLNSKLNEQSEEAAKVVGDDRKESDYRWSAGTSQGSRH